MSDIKLFDISGNVKELQNKVVALEKELQTIIEKNMESFFAVKFLETEYKTTNGGRMDSIGIDENDSPVIFEYKRSMNENVINQGLFYLDWLLDHKSNYEVLVAKQLGEDAAKKVDWTSPRVVCVANDFTKYDESAIKQMKCNITLFRYKKFGENLLMFERLNENTVGSLSGEKSVGQSTYYDKSVSAKYEDSSEEMKILYDDLKNFVLSLGDDVSESIQKLYVAFKKIRNFICVELFKEKMTIYLKLDPETFQYEEGFSRNMRDVGHRGTGDVSITVKNHEDLAKAKPFIQQAYNEI